MNHPTERAKRTIEALTEEELRNYDMRSVHSDGSVTFYWESGKKIHVESNGDVIRSGEPTHSQTLPSADAFGWNESIGAMRGFLIGAAKRAAIEGRIPDNVAILQEIRED